MKKIRYWDFNLSTVPKPMLYIGARFFGNTFGIKFQTEILNAKSIWNANCT